MNQQTAMLETRYYNLRPGDATPRYRFSITWPQVARGSFTNAVDLATHEIYDVEIGRLVDGLREGRVLVTIYTPYWQGASTTSVAALQPLWMSHVAYMADHMGNDANLRDVTAVLLAVGVLATDPLNLEAACKAMLRAPEVMRL